MKKTLIVKVTEKKHNNSYQHIEAQSKSSLEANSSEKILETGSSHEPCERRGDDSSSICTNFIDSSSVSFNSSASVTNNSNSPKLLGDSKDLTADDSAKKSNEMFDSTTITERVGDEIANQSTAHSTAAVISESASRLSTSEKDVIDSDAIKHSGLRVPPLKIFLSSTTGEGMGSSTGRRALSPAVQSSEAVSNNGNAPRTYVVSKEMPVVKESSPKGPDDNVLSDQVLSPPPLVDVAAGFSEVEELTSAPVAMRLMRSNSNGKTPSSDVTYNYSSSVMVSSPVVADEYSNDALFVQHQEDQTVSFLTTTDAQSSDEMVLRSGEYNEDNSSNNYIVEQQQRAPSSNLSEYQVKKRKLRSQGGDVECGTTSSSVTRFNNPFIGSNSAQLMASEHGLPIPTGEVVKPLGDIEKFLNIRKQIDQRRKNLFPVQPKPPQGFKDYLMNRKTYLLEGNDSERLRSIPVLPVPSCLANEPELKEMFLAQEKDRYALRRRHLVEKEKLILAVEQEILRVHGRAARALANQSVPYSVCTILRDEEIYTPLDLQQEEKNRDIRSRYNGRLFISWLQDVDDKWEKIKEQMVLRHHHEAESLNSVQKMDWEGKVFEMELRDSKQNIMLDQDDNYFTRVDDQYVPLVHVSDDFDLLDGRQ